MVADVTPATLSIKGCTANPPARGAAAHSHSFVTGPPARPHGRRQSSQSWRRAERCSGRALPSGPCLTGGGLRSPSRATEATPLFEGPRMWLQSSARHWHIRPSATAPRVRIPVPRRLNRWTGCVGIGTKDATVSRLRFQKCAAFRAIVKILASIGRHGLQCTMAAFRACNCRLMQYNHVAQISHQLNMDVG